MSQYNTLKEAVYEANILLPKLDLVSYTFGNASQIDRDKGVIGIKPSGIPYNSITINDIVIVDLEGNVVEGKFKPSSDTKAHLILYKNLQKIGGIVHTYSTFAIAWSQAMKPIPILGTFHADHMLREIPCTETMTDDMIKGDYERESGHQILEVMKNMDCEEVEMILVASHGPFCWGKNVETALQNSVLLEKIAKLAYLTLQINPAINPLAKKLVHKHYKRKHGKDAYYGQE
ncbi:MAG: L-ribulose-5-phosphate 4-epimerase AraD [Bacteroidales bacterium]|nr:L-ribulose-5-phosphate 4-epimerase AraD [Bacteroidales bacterium]